MKIGRRSIRKSVVSILAIVFLISAVNCSKKMEPSGGDAKSKSGVATRTSSMFDDYQYEVIQSNESEIQYKFEGKPMPNMKVGDFLVHHEWPSIHQLLKIVGVSKQGNLLTIKITEADMTDVGENIPVTKSGEVEVTEPIAVNEFVEYDDGSIELTAQVPEEAMDILTESTDAAAVSKGLWKSIKKTVKKAGKAIKKAGKKIVKEVKRFGKKVKVVGSKIVYNLKSATDYLIKKLNIFKDYELSFTKSLGNFKVSRSLGVNEKNVNANISVSANFNPKLKVKIKINLLKKLKELETIAIADFGYKISGNISATGRKSFSKGKTLLRKSKTYLYFIGYWPIWITITGEVAARVKAETFGNAKASVQLEGQYNFTKGLKYPGWKIVGDGLKTVKKGSSFNYNVHAGLTFRPYIDGKLKLKIYSIMGPQMSVQPYIEFAAILKGNNNYGHRASLGVYAGIDVYFALKSVLFSKWLNFGPKKIYGYRKTLKKKEYVLTKVKNPSGNGVSPGIIDSGK